MKNINPSISQAAGQNRNTAIALSAKLFTTLFSIIFIMQCGMSQSPFDNRVRTASFVTAPASDTVAAGKSQEEIQTEFMEWLTSAKVESGSYGVLNFEFTPETPALQGGTTKVTFSYVTKFGETLTATSSFTVNGNGGQATNNPAYTEHFGQNPITIHNTMDYGVTAESESR